MPSLLIRSEARDRQPLAQRLAASTEEDLKPAPCGSEPKFPGVPRPRLQASLPQHAPAWRLTCGDVGCDRPCIPP